MKRLTVGYVQFHNKKYGRTGHLFLNRYHSEVVENDRYLLRLPGIFTGIQLKPI